MTERTELLQRLEAELLEQAKTWRLSPVVEALATALNAEPQSQRKLKPAELTIRTPPTRWRDTDGAGP